MTTCPVCEQSAELTALSLSHPPVRTEGPPVCQTCAERIGRAVEAGLRSARRRKVSAQLAERKAQAADRPEPTYPPLSAEQERILQTGICPFCSQAILNYVHPRGPSAAVAVRNLEANGVDSQNGHRKDCPRSDLRIGTAPPRRQFYQIMPDRDVRDPDSLLP